MSQLHEHISEELLARYLAKTASAAEQEQVERWLHASPANRDELRGYELIWQHAGNKAQHLQVNTDAAWAKVKGQMREVNPPVEDTAAREIVFEPVRKNRSWFLSIAAAITLLVAAFGWYFVQNSRPEDVIVATTNETKDQILPDGTKVFLNHNSSISYPDQFEGETRMVVLKGEAFFDVKRNETKPFIIEANGAQVKVLGTSFNVKAYKEKPVRVDVESGKVQVSKANRQVQLQKGEGAEVSNENINKIRADINAIAYRTQIYDFQATSLADIVAFIHEGYHVNVKLSNEQIAQCKLTIRFEKQPVDTILSIVAESLSLDLRKEGDTYWLDGTGCQ